MVTITQVDTAEESTISSSGCAKAWLCCKGMGGAIERLNGGMRGVLIHISGIAGNVSIFPIG